MLGNLDFTGIYRDLLRIISNNVGFFIYSSIENNSFALPNSLLISD